MNVVYDGHVFRWQRVGGVSRYFREIISRLPAEWSPTILGAGNNNDLPNHPRGSFSPITSIRPRRFTQPIRRILWRRRHLERAAIFHPTYYNLTGGLRYHDIKCPVVITVHDLIAATYPHLEENSAATLRDQLEAVQFASHAICVSEYTEQDLLNKYPQLIGRTSVIYHGSSFPVCAEVQPETIFSKPTFLYVGRRATYKNFQLLLRAFSNACQLHQTIRLCAAGAAFTEEEKWQIHFLGLSSRVDEVVFPTEDSLQRLYRNSVALLYPSRHEGFGIPPLEAMACGTLAVTSNTTSLPEVVGEGGIMLDPTDESAWTECILSIANQRVPRSKIIERGRLRVTELTWDASAKAHIEVYKRLA